MKTIDLRSDTVTKPTPAMRQAMAEAAVGDDVYGEDPSVNRLEEMAAAVMQKEAALFVPSGSMGNQLAIMTHCERGVEVICDSLAHVFHYEMAAAAALSGVQLHPIDNLHNEAGIASLNEHIRNPRTFPQNTFNLFGKFFKPGRRYSDAAGTMSRFIVWPRNTDLRCIWTGHVFLMLL